MDALRVGLLGERLATVLRERIIRGEIGDGTRLVEGSLATEFDVSRGPVRDALKILAGEGLVESHRRGVSVRSLRVRDVDELYALREAIETLALRSAAASAAPSSWQAAERELGRMVSAADSADQREFASHDLAFHDVLYRLAGNSRLSTTWEQYRPTFAVMLGLTNERDVDLHPAADDHRRLLEAAINRDVRRAERILIGHLAGSRHRMQEALVERGLH